MSGHISILLHYFPTSQKNLKSEQDRILEKYSGPSLESEEEEEDTAAEDFHFLYTHPHPVCGEGQKTACGRWSWFAPIV